MMAPWTAARQRVTAGRFGAAPAAASTRPRYSAAQGVSRAVHTATMVSSPTWPMRVVSEAWVTVCTQPQLTTDGRSSPRSAWSTDTLAPTHVDRRGDFDDGDERSDVEHLRAGEDVCRPRPLPARGRRVSRLAPGFRVGSDQERSRGSECLE